MKTKEELNAIKNAVDALNAKLSDLTDEEMMQVTGGIWYPFKNKELPSTGIEGEKDQPCGFIGAIPRLP